MENKNYKEFWGEVNKSKNYVNSQSNIIDGETDMKNIAELFSKKYKKIFDKQGNQTSDADIINIDLSNKKSGEIINHFTAKDIRKAINKLKHSMGP